MSSDFFLLFTNGAVLDLKLGILAKIQFGHLYLLISFN
jgi:hypothetical protein